MVMKRPRFFSRSFLRSAKILMQNGAILRNTLRMRNHQTPSASNAVQNSEMMCNSLGVNYESPALTAELQARCARQIRTGRQILPF